MTKITIDREVLLHQATRLEDAASGYYSMSDGAKETVRDVARNLQQAALTAVEDRPVAGPDTVRADGEATNDQ